MNININNADSPGTSNEQREYPFRGLCISGFAMLFFTFVLLPAIIITSVSLWIETIPALAVTIGGFCFISLGVSDILPRNQMKPG